jgi:hypothetical protein
MTHDTRRAALGRHELYRTPRTGPGALQSVEVPAGNAQAAQAGGRAVLCCAMCGETARCRTFLAAGGGDGFEVFCPNAGFIRALKHGRYRA